MAPVALSLALALCSAFIGDTKYNTPATPKEINTAKKPINIPMLNRYFTYSGSVEFIDMVWPDTIGYLTSRVEVDATLPAA